MKAKHGDRITGPILREMVYADAVIRETLRVQNVVAGLTRSAAKDFELGGYRWVAVRYNWHMSCACSCMLVLLQLMAMLVGTEVTGSGCAYVPSRRTHVSDETRGLSWRFSPSTINHDQNRKPSI